ISLLIGVLAQPTSKLRTAIIRLRNPSLLRYQTSSFTTVQAFGPWIPLPIWEMVWTGDVKSFQTVLSGGSVELQMVFRLEMTSELCPVAVLISTVSAMALISPDRRGNENDPPSAR